MLCNADDDMIQILVTVTSGMLQKACGHKHDFEWMECDTPLRNRGSWHHAHML